MKDMFDYMNTIDPDNGPENHQIPSTRSRRLGEWADNALDEIYQMLADLRPWWHQYAACRGMAAEHHEDGNIFFPPKGDMQAIREAQAICNTCAVQPECREAGLNDPVDGGGIWGGLSERERRRVRTVEAIKRPTHVPWKRLVDPFPHGTDAGYARHVRAGDKACEPCQHAHKTAQQGRRRTA